MSLGHDLKGTYRYGIKGIADSKAKPRTEVWVKDPERGDVAIGWVEHCCPWHHFDEPPILLLGRESEDYQLARWLGEYDEHPSTPAIYLTLSRRSSITGEELDLLYCHVHDQQDLFDRPDFIPL
jgi:hypothetical protein